jgi:hypothetical protein
MDINKVINDIFLEEGIYEVLVSSNGVSPNISPIGVIKKGNKLYFKLYENTLTLKNIEINSKCGIIITSDASLFYYALIDKLKIDYFYYEIPMIKNELTIIALCKMLDNKNPRTILVEPTEILGEYKPRAFNRGEALFIDMLVHFTRLNIYNKSELEYYIKILNYEINIVKKTAPWLKDILSEIENKIKIYE